MFSENQFLWKVLLIALSVTTASFALPTGAPKSACHDMTPHHRNFKAQLGSLAPYRLNVSKSEIDCGEVIQVTLQGIQDTDKFRGFFIQARELKVDGSLGDDPIGKFTIPDGNVFARLVDCGDEIGVTYFTSIYFWVLIAINYFVLILERRNSP